MDLASPTHIDADLRVPRRRTHTHTHTQSFSCLSQLVPQLLLQSLCLQPLPIQGQKPVLEVTCTCVCARGFRVKNVRTVRYR